METVIQWTAPAPKYGKHHLCKHFEKLTSTERTPGMEPSRAADKDAKMTFIFAVVDDLVRW